MYKFARFAIFHACLTRKYDVLKEIVDESSQTCKFYRDSFA